MLFCADATRIRQGKALSEAALYTYEQGKDKVGYSPHLEKGDVVIVKNAEHVVFTGKKWKQKLYRHHTG